MNKQILEEKVYYYPDAIENISELMKTINLLDKSIWKDWKSSNDDFIYGKTSTFNLDEINIKNDIDKQKMFFIYNTIMDSLYSVSKDYAVSLGDNDEPNLFPTFNIKQYNTGVGMGSHFDQLDGDKTLRYSLVMYLNDDCEGGEISFTLSDYEGILNKQNPDLDYDKALNEGTIDFGIKPKAGSVIIFPSSAPYHHTAHIVKKGIKYMVPGHWIHNNVEMRKGNMS